MCPHILDQIGPRNKCSSLCVCVCVCECACVRPQRGRCSPGSDFYEAMIRFCLNFVVKYEADTLSAHVACANTTRAHTCTAQTFGDKQAKSLLVLAVHNSRQPLPLRCITLVGSFIFTSFTDTHFFFLHLSLYSLSIPHTVRIKIETQHEGGGSDTHHKPHQARRDRGRGTAAREEARGNERQREKKRERGSRGLF